MSKDIDMKDITKIEYNIRNEFALKPKISEMFLIIKDNIQIPFKEILEIAQKIPSDKYENENLKYSLNNCNKELYISYINEIKFNFEIENIIGTNILQKPLNLRKSEYSSDFYEIICNEQLECLRNNFENSTFGCPCSQITIEISLLNLSIHQNDNKTHNVYLKNKKEFNRLDESSLNNKKIYIDFIGKTFDKPQDFEKNFIFYFNQKINTSFHIFDDNSNQRKIFSTELKNFQPKIIYYYGLSGKGKSVTLIGTLKYNINLLKYGTFYLNCKTMKTLLENGKELIAKQIFIDEIAYLFIGDYKNYENVCDIIGNYIFENNYSFWDLTIEILNYCGNEKKYIIGFDQYNDSNDKYCKIKKIEETFNKSKLFKFLLFCSMNETDIRKLKIDKLLNESNKKDSRELIKLCDMDDVIKNNETNINKIEAFIKLGKTFKVYNELQTMNIYDIKNYLQEKKEKYLYKIISFYTGNEYNNKNNKIENIMNIDEKYYQKLLSFKINKNYTKKELINIINNIPFRFFDILMNNNKYYITTNFPLIDDLLKDIYFYIIHNKNYLYFQKILNNKGSALGTLFKYKVIYNICNNNINYFLNVNISETLSLEILIPKNNQNYTPKFKKNLDNDKTYLITQEQFGGKDLDFLIIKMKNNIPIIYGFQVSIHKNNIFIIDDLEKSYNKLKKNLNISFKLNIEDNNMYFGYIFDYSRIKTLEYEIMLKKCKKKNLPYVFFNPEDNKFYSQNGVVVYNIESFNKNIYSIKSNNKLITDYFSINYNYFISNKQMNIIINFLSKKLQKSIKNLKFIEKVNNIEYNNNYIYISNPNNSLIILLFFENNILRAYNLLQNKELSMREFGQFYFNKYVIE